MILYSILRNQFMLLYYSYWKAGDEAVDPTASTETIDFLPNLELNEQSWKLSMKEQVHGIKKVHILFLQFIRLTHHTVFFLSNQSDFRNSAKSSC